VRARSRNGFALQIAAISNLLFPRSQTDNFHPDKMNIENEIARRRAFAIISHPDAGKTTLTEKFLLYGGAVQLAGSVTARKNQRATTSDWMELERQRGISVSSTVLQFDYRGYAVNLLDTPGHKDFCEDTYRVLMAVDAVIMVIDAAKGIETQTRKLFEICRLRRIPIFTFINKLDRPSREPLKLLDELESVLELRAFPMNWPLGDGIDFRGIYDRIERQVHFFERVPGGSYRAPVSLTSLADPLVKEKLDPQVYQKVTEEMALMEEMAGDCDPSAIQRGEVTPVFFGSALNNFGVQLLLDTFLDQAPRPGPRLCGKELISPEHPRFSGFIFKIQSNMDPRHRDQIAFLRICSGRFTRDMKAIHTRTGAAVRLSSSHKLFARERQTVDEAFPGDVIGLVGYPEFAIGDTLSEDPAIFFQEIPRFAPECFAFLHAVSTAQHKRFRAGLESLLQEGVVQSLLLKNSSQRVPLLAAVGPLQFEVMQHRLKAEFGAESRLEHASWKVMRWVDPSIAIEALDEELLPTGCKLAEDNKGRQVILFTEEWTCDFFHQKNPGIKTGRLPFDECFAVQGREKSSG
jgi:peptide chain release factor 3